MSTLIFGTCHFKDHQIISVRRKYILQDVKRSFSKSYINFSLHLCVVFVGESAAYHGGPKREFFRLALGACFAYASMFQHCSSGCIPVHNITALMATREKRTAQKHTTIASTALATYSYLKRKFATIALVVSNFYRA